LLIQFIFVFLSEVVMFLAVGGVKR
jgi:hypothetical protein